jgi:MinD superfamily P-loop ATPase
MILAVASGKGGTGKTTVSANLARVAGQHVQLLDCDVEKPNAHLFLKGTLHSREEVCVPVPRVDESLCTGCGECSSFCRFHAIASLDTGAIVFPELCHGCGGCSLVCPRNAITEQDHRIGVIEIFKTGSMTLIQGKLDIGAAMASPLIRSAKARLSRDISAILDAPPGTSCPVITTIRDADLVILVTEPTPFGLHDLKLAVDMVRELKIPHGVVINRVGSGDDRTRVYCRENRIPVLMEFPDDREIAQAYSRGELIVDTLPMYRRPFENLLSNSLEFRQSNRRSDEHADL